MWRHSFWTVVLPRQVSDLAGDGSVEREYGTSRSGGERWDSGRFAGGLLVKGKICSANIK
jgi:hypothetical protein